jgi:hypothetical protein
MTHNSTEKFMFTIVWNPREFHSIKVLAKGRKLNAGYYIAEILEPLSQWRSIEAAATSENCWCVRTMRARSVRLLKLWTWRPQQFINTLSYT